MVMTFVLGGWAALRPTAPLTFDIPVDNYPSMSAAVVVSAPSVSDTFRPILAATDRFTPVAWLGSSAALLSVLAVGLTLLRLRSRRWTRTRLDGEDVALSHDFGPALVGVLHPVIVMPHWVLQLSSHERTLALRHEVEHRNARDTLVLSMGAIVCAVMPWNASLWFINRRLRQAVELDCDRRVLDAGWAPADYGSLLIELSAASAPSRLPVAAISQPTSLLERRLTMMTKTKMTRGSIMATVGTTLAAALLLVSACETPPPSMTGPETEAAAESMFAVQVAPSGLAPSGVVLEGGEKPLVIVDGVEVDRAELESIAPESIERVDVFKGERAIELYGDEGERGVVQIFLKASVTEEGTDFQITHAEDGEHEATGYLLRQSTPDRQTADGERSPVGPDSPTDWTTTTLLVDGERMYSMDDIDPSDIERVDVVRGADVDEVRVTLKR
jgi:beta-lactamase regulating signal transducer with metallopeptidase domain